MSETARIRWHETPVGILCGYVGSLESQPFGIWKPPQASGEWVLTTELPGMEGKRLYGDDPEKLKPEAERWLVAFAASLGAFFPPAGDERLTCNSCLHAPASVLAVLGRTNADRTPAPGHVLRLLCDDDCAGRTRDICGRAGRAVTFVPLTAPVMPFTLGAVFGSARCGSDVPDPDTDPEECLAVPCPELSRFIVARSDGDTSFGENGGSAEACEGHLAETVAGMAGGDTGIRAVVTIRWDDSGEAASGG